MALNRTAATPATQSTAARRAIKVVAPNAASAVKAAVSAPDTLVRAERAVLKAPTSNNKVTLHVTPTASHQALLESIRTAKSSFYIETFIWHNDEAGNEVIDAIAKRIKDAKAKGETFDCKIMIDWFGLRQGTGGKSDPEVVNKLRAAGAEVLEFAPGYVDGGKLIPITHRKLYIKDGASFITGGRNIGNEYLKPEYEVAGKGKEASWHDLLYTVEGNETGRIIDEFFKNWVRSGGQKPAVMPTIVPAAAGKAKVQSFVTNPHTGNRDLQKAHYELIANAEKEIMVIYPYFSDDKLVDALKAAKAKNPALTIKVMLPANKEASHEGSIYSLLNKESARQLIGQGIEVRMFDGGDVQRFSHFKAMVIDNQVVSIGSANGDHRTFNNNHELNTIIADRATAQDFNRQVASPDWSKAVPVSAAELKAESFWTRVKMAVLEALDFLL